MNQCYLQQVWLTESPPEDDYLAALPVVRHLAQQPLCFSAPVTLLVGENGVGKSTLIEAIAVGMGFNAEGGTKNFQFATAETHSALHACCRFVRGPYAPQNGFFLRAESFYNAATYIDQISDSKLLAKYGGRSLHEQSHGESFLALMRNRMDGRGIYIFDEPEAALSPASMMEMLCHLRRLENDASQIIIATHSPILMTYPGAALLEITPAGIHSVDYRHTAHYQLTRRFLERPEAMYRMLFAEN